MKIAITSQGPGLEDRVDPRFGRSPYFIIVDPNTMDFEAVENQNVSGGGGVGVKSAQLMADKEVKYVLTGDCGPKAYQVLGEAGIEVIVGLSGKVNENIEKYKKGEFKPAEASAPANSGKSQD